jgi:GT2 family glycosyltransferase
MEFDLMRAHRALCTDFVDDGLFRRALGGTRGDIGTIGRYLQLPILRRPNLAVYFDREFYLGLNDDVRASGADPLLHFIDTGFKELRAPHPLIDLRLMMREDPAILGDPPDLAALMELLDYDLARPSAYFDPEYYVRSLGSVAPANGLLRHFLTEGLAAGLRPSELFDPQWYRGAYPDVPQDPYGALRHFVILGDIEGRRPGPTFDGRFYLKRYPDVADTGMPPLYHFLTFGRIEGRQPAAERAAPPPPVGGVISVDVGAPASVSPIEVLGVHNNMTGRIAAAMQKAKDAVRSAPVLKIAKPAAGGNLRGVVFRKADAPRLSIVVPMYDEFDYTVACLSSLSRSSPETVFEVIVADDCSSDPGVARLAGLRNLVYFRQPENLGFIRNCNAAFARCRGEYVLLLNNDTEVMAGAIDRLVAALDADPAVAAVGPKLIYPDGRLQEAGCYLKPNGESGMVGLFADPDEPGYVRDRDVPYCSGAALMFRRALVEGDLFDEEFRPAYCEDADLCLRLRASGHRIRFVHDAVVVHHLSVSSNRQSVARKLRTITRNQQKLVARWGERLLEMDRIRPIAFYLPQFHPTEENDFWWGAGFTEWTNVVKARPGYSGQYQPHLPADLGFYDLRSPETLTHQANLARRYGIEGFCVYYYNFGSRRLLSRPLEVVRAHPEIPFHFCLCWANENWTKHWDGGSREILVEQGYDDETIAGILSDVAGHASDPRALRVDGKPLFLVYRPLLIPDPPRFAAACRAAFEHAGLPGVHLVYVESMEAVDQGIVPLDLGFDASVEFPPQGRAVPSKASVEIVKPGWSGYRYDYADTAVSFVSRASVAYPRYPAVFPSWDNTARQPLKGTSFDGCSPAAFRVFVEAKIEEIRRFHMGDSRLLFVNAWNEWAEGAHLEPDTAHGHAWLEALRDGLDASRFA